MVDIIRAADFQMRHLLLALRAGEPYRVSRALAVEAGYHAISGGRRQARTRKVLQANRLLAERIQNQHPHAIGLATMVEGMAAFLEGRWQDAKDIQRTSRTHPARALSRSRLGTGDDPAHVECGSVLSGRASSAGGPTSGPIEGSRGAR